MKPAWRKAVVESRNGSGFVSSGAAFSELLAAVLAKGKPFRFTARGMSMSPFIKDGDLITVSPFLKNSSLQLGNVTAILHPDSGKLLVHRVIKKNGRGVQTKGDNSTARDGLFPIEAVLGLVSRIERSNFNIYTGPCRKDLFVALFSRLGLFPSRLSRIFPQNT